jgi:hypothetical protein
MGIKKDISGLFTQDFRLKDNEKVTPALWDPQGGRYLVTRGFYWLVVQVVNTWVYNSRASSPQLGSGEISACLSAGTTTAGSVFSASSMNASEPVIPLS